MRSGRNADGSGEIQRERIRRHSRHVRVQCRALAPGLRHQHVLHVADEGREPQGLQGERSRGTSKQFPLHARADATRSSSATTTACSSSAATSISPPSSARPTGTRSAISPRVMTGSTQDDYAEMMLGGGRSVEGNRVEVGQVRQARQEVEASARKPQRNPSKETEVSRG